MTNEKEKGHDLLTPEECRATHGPNHGLDGGGPACNICDGGLAYCKRCHGGESELDESCDSRLARAALDPKPQTKGE
jgi:hypothetical protein